MLNYIIRRLFLMLPTLLGITLLVFVIVASAPGGIGAALTAGGGQMDPTSAAQRQAYLEDRYGLDDPIIVQYARWLSRVSPIKFGSRDQVDLAGDLIQPPKALKDPPLYRWFVERLPEPPAPAFAGFARSADADPAVQITQEVRHRAYRNAANEYARTRAAYVGSTARFEQAVLEYADELGIQGARRDGTKLRVSSVEGREPDKAAKAWPAVEAAGAKMLSAYDAAQASLQELKAVFAAKPYPEAGFGISGVVHVAAPDLGVSFSRGRRVTDLIASSLPITIILNVIATILIYSIAIPSGIFAATHRGSLLDSLSGATYIALWSFPIVLAGVLFVGILANREFLGAFPVSGLNSPDAESFRFFPSFSQAGDFQRGWLLDSLWHIAGPVLCLTYGGFAVLSKQARAAMLDNFNADYVRTAKAKGVAPKDVVMRHVFRNSLLPLITMFVTVFPAMLAGSVVIERIFSIEGMGKLAIDAINLRDRELILATSLIAGMVNLLALLLADILYAIADPRISYE